MRLKKQVDVKKDTHSLLKKVLRIATYIQSPNISPRCAARPGRAWKSCSQPITDSSTYCPIGHTGCATRKTRSLRDTEALRTKFGEMYLKSYYRMNTFTSRSQLIKAFYEIINVVESSEAMPTQVDQPLSFITVLTRNRCPLPYICRLWQRVRRTKHPTKILVLTRKNIMSRPISPLYCIPWDVK